MITFFDVALYRANESSLMATICTANGLLKAFLALKYHARCLLHLLIEERVGLDGDTGTHQSNAGLKRVAVLCVECANGAIAALTTEPLSTAANIQRK